MINNSNVIDVYPLKKSKRILTWLGDFFINFIATILLFNILALPVAKAIINYDDVTAARSDAEDHATDVLYGNKVLFYEENEWHDFERSLLTTFDYFMSYHVQDQKSEDNVYLTYYVSIKADNQGLQDLYASRSGDTYFNLDVLDANGVPTLKENYVEEFKALFIEGDTLSANAQTDYEDISSLFLKYYYAMMSDVQVNDLTYDSMSYIELNNQAAAYTQKLDYTVVWASIVSYLISIIIFYVIVPLFAVKGQTITEKIMKVNKVGQNNLRIISKPERILQASYAVFTNMTLMVVTVVPMVTITYAFNLPLLLFFSIFGLVYGIASLIFVLFNQYNKTLTDAFSKVILLEDLDLQKVVKAKGNKF